MSNWIKILNSLPAHPKILRAGDRAAWLFVCGLCYANEHLTDGYLAREVLVVAAPGVKAPERLAGALVDAGLWDVVEGGWQVHDYGDYQRTSKQVKDTRRKDRERKGSADSNRIPPGIHADSEPKDVGIPSRVRAGAPSQEKKREEENTPHSPQGAGGGEVEQEPASIVVRRLFARWQSACHHETAKLTSERRRKIEARLREGYTEQQIVQAIDGAARAAFVNDAGKRFDDIELICRNGSKLEDFIGRASGATASSRPLTSVELAERLRGGPAA